MDMNILIIIGCVGYVIGLTILVIYLRKNKIVTKQDLETVKEIFQLSTQMMQELNLKNEPQLIQISQIVLTSLDFACMTYSNVETEELLDIATKKTYELCNDLNIELNDNRKSIIKQFITLGLSNRFIKSVDGYHRIKKEVDL